MAREDDDTTVASTPKTPPGGGVAHLGSLRSVGAALDVLECFAADGTLRPV